MNSHLRVLEFPRLCRKSVLVRVTALGVFGRTPVHLVMTSRASLPRLLSLSRGLFPRNPPHKPGRSSIDKKLTLKLREQV